MLKNHIKIAWRNLLKSKFYSAINIFGLTVGLAIGSLVLLWVQDELSFDSFHDKGKNIYRVNSFLGTGSNKRIWDDTQAPVATYALREIPGVKSAVRIYPGPKSIYTYQDKLIKEEHTAFTDPSFFTLFNFKLIVGDAQHPFVDDHSVVITKSTASKYFGNDNPIGKTLVQDHKDSYTVSGVIPDFPDNSSINYDMLFSMNVRAKDYDGTSFWKSMDSDWGNFGYSTYLEIEPGTPIKPIGEKLIRIQMKNAPHIKVALPEDAFQLQPLTTIHLYGADGSGSGMQTIRIFLAVALLILLIASINCVNLSTARAMMRAREVSIRKIIGAQKQQLFAQFIIEFVMFFFISMVLAFFVMSILMPYYNNISGKNLHFDLTNGGIWKVMLITVFSTLSASAIYPSLLLSSFEPLKALKGKLSMGIANVTFRRILVTTQFVFSVTLIIITLIIGRQLKFIREKDPGYDRTQVFSFKTAAMASHLEAVEAQLKSQPGITGITTSDNKLVNNMHTTGGVDWDGKESNSMFIIHHFGIDQKFIPMMKIQILEGSNFTGSKSDSAHFILNETAVKLTGIKNPIGKRFKYQETEGMIIGVVKDFNAASLKERIEPAVIYYEPAGRLLYVKTTGRDAANVIKACKHIWDTYNPGFPFEYNFMDEEYGALYNSDQRTGTLFSLFSIIAIVISCLGLFGLATYTAQVMTKEIGIRKVLGASVSSIVALLSRDFLKLITLAIIIASPIAWWAMHKWLQNFTYSIHISIWLFVAAGIIAIGTAMLTIGYHAVKAAIANPVKSLRNE